MYTLHYQYSQNFLNVFTRSMSLSATVTSGWLVISCLSSSQTAVTIIKPPNIGDVRSTVALHFIVSIRQTKVVMCIEQGNLKCHISFIVTVIYRCISDDQCLLMGSNVHCSTDKVTFYAFLCIYAFYVFFCSSWWFHMSSHPVRESLKFSRTTGHIRPCWGGCLEDGVCQPEICKYTLLYTQLIHVYITTYTTGQESL